MNYFTVDVRSGRQSGLKLDIETVTSKDELARSKVFEAKVTSACERYRHLVGKTIKLRVEHLLGENPGVAIAH